MGPWHGFCRNLKHGPLFIGCLAHHNFAYEDSELTAPYCGTLGSALLTRVF